MKLILKRLLECIPFNLLITNFAGDASKVLVLFVSTQSSERFSKTTNLTHLTPLFYISFELESMITVTPTTPSNCNCLQKYLQVETQAMYSSNEMI